MSESATKPAKPIMRRGSYAPPKITAKNDDLQKVINKANAQKSAMPKEADGRTVPEARRRTKHFIMFKLDRQEMTSEQRQIYDMTALQVKLVRAFPNYLRQADDFTFIEMIGKGGFGHVWLANDLKTGNVVAIKELHKIDGKTQSPLLRFIREVQTMVQVKSRFILPIYGFTAEPPFSIIMPCMSSNTLNDILIKKQYSPTDLDIYAICIARGMKDIHKAGVIYRDLKATNILMDSEGFPIICDFGTAKICSDDDRMSLRAGTFCFMAPEVYTSDHYTKKCDIFSYGSLLYEMSEFSIPLKKFSEKERLDFMLSGKYAEFHKDKTPKPLRKLIVRCWDLDPNKRPTWDEIIESFESGQVSFKGSNDKKLKQTIQRINSEVSNYKPFVPLPSSKNIQQLLDDLHDHLYKNPLFKEMIDQGKIGDLVTFEKPVVHNSDLGNDFKIEAPSLSIPVSSGSQNDSSYNDFAFDVAEEENNLKENNLDDSDEKLTPHMILRNPDLPEFPEYLEFLADELQPRQFQDFFQTTLSYIRGFWECKQIPLVFGCYESLVRRNQEFLNLCVNYGFFKMISKKTLRLSMNMVSMLVHFRPRLIGASEKNLIIQLLDDNPFETVYILGEAANNVESIKEPDAIFDALMAKSDLFIDHQTGKIFLGIFYSLFFSKSCYKGKSADIKNLFVTFLENDRSIHKVTAINGICHLYDSSISLKFQCLISLISENEACAKATISLLMRMTNYPISSEFCRAVVDAIDDDANAFYVLLKFASEGVKQCKLLLEYPKWMISFNKSGKNNQLIWFALQLFMVICLNGDVRNDVLKINEFHDFIKNLFILDSRTVFVALNAAFKKMNINQEFIDKIAKSGVLDSFIKKCYDPKMAPICIMTLQSFVSHGYSDKFECLIDMAAVLLNDEKFDLITKKAVLHFLCVLAPLKNMTEKIKNCSDLMNFVKTDKTPDLIKYIKIFVHSIGLKDSH